MLNLSSVEAKLAREQARILGVARSYMPPPLGIPTGKGNDYERGYVAGYDAYAKKVQAVFERFADNPIPPDA